MRSATDELDDYLHRQRIRIGGIKHVTNKEPVSLNLRGNSLFEPIGNHEPPPASSSRPIPTPSDPHPLIREWKDLDELDFSPRSTSFTLSDGFSTPSFLKYPETWEEDEVKVPERGFDIGEKIRSLTDVNFDFDDYDSVLAEVERITGDLLSSSSSEDEHTLDVIDDPWKGLKFSSKNSSPIQEDSISLSQESTPIDANRRDGPHSNVGKEFTNLNLEREMELLLDFLKSPDAIQTQKEDGELNLSMESKCTETQTSPAVSPRSVDATGVGSVDETKYSTFFETQVQKLADLSVTRISIADIEPVVPE